METTADTTAILSESTNTVVVECAKGFEFVPSDTGKVCTETEAHSLEDCEPQKRNPAAVSLISDFVTATPTPPVTLGWTRNNEKHSLTIPEANFPLVDRKFFVGCRPSEKDESCVVKISMSARKTLLKENVLTCSYGAESNQPVPKTTLDSTNNSLTVVCGTYGTMPLTAGVPTIYLCKDPETDVCTTVEDVTEVFPGFSKAWWTKQDGQENAAKLTIPKDGFPVEPKTIMFGCSLQVQPPPQKDAPKEDGLDATVLPTCKVKVTVAASASSFSSTGFSVGVFLSSVAPLVVASRPASATVLGMRKPVARDPPAGRDTSGIQDLDHGSCEKRRSGLLLGERRPEGTQVGGHEQGHHAAYGVHNSQVPDVTVDSTNNSAPLLCGSGGTVPLTDGIPTVYYCKDPSTEACDKIGDITEILPGFSRKWWPTAENRESAKFTTPAGGFPRESKTILSSSCLAPATPKELVSGLRFHLLALWVKGLRY
ncbi:SAG-related sequence [Besnoitia besnoiti]|uniref:SAG-related sequence n=1 Tax=Besnoitia besnoiti TaxID=94643 RepID=A0A2A9MI48_BESBE|nr:SAG-related sequence [Besnoitia besnoiti]PFH35267.1 SAG-related sequence [Besnoitia besnoiti]